jgi:tryptophan synthase alpha subunit
VADGIIVGSRLVREFEESNDTLIPRLGSIVRQLKDALLRA